MHDFRKPCEICDGRFKLIAENEVEPKFTHHTHSKLTHCRSRGNLSWGVATLAALIKKLQSYWLQQRNGHIKLDFNLKERQKALDIKSDWTMHFRTEMNKTIRHHASNKHKNLCIADSNHTAPQFPACWNLNRDEEGDHLPWSTEVTPR